jgi:hypothetical protein
MPGNLIFLGLHFTISKRALFIRTLLCPVEEQSTCICAVYANSLLATLNSRRMLRKRKKVNGEHALPVMFPSYDTRARSRARFTTVSLSVGSLQSSWHF